MKELTSSKQGRTTTIQDREISHKRTGHSKEVNRVHKNRRSQGANVPPPTSSDSYPVLREEVEEAVKSLKKRQVGRRGQYSIPSELVQAGGEALIDMLLIICSKIWQTGDWPTPWSQSLIITLLKKGNLQLCQNYRAISLISHPRKVMLGILLNRLKPQAEDIFTEQAGFRAGRGTTENIFNLGIHCEK